MTQKINAFSKSSKQEIESKEFLIGFLNPFLLEVMIEFSIKAKTLKTIFILKSSKLNLLLIVCHSNTFTLKFFS